MYEIATTNRDKIILWISHGFCSNNIKTRAKIPNPNHYNYGSVNRYVFDDINKTWNLIDIDSKYH